MFRLCLIAAACFLFALQAGGQEASFRPRTDLEQGRFLKVLAETDAILARDANSALAWAAKAQALGALMRFGEAEAAAERAIALQPDLPDALMGRSMAKAGLALQQRNLSSLSRVSQAMGDLRAAVNNDPGYALAWMTLGLGYQQLPGILGGSARRALDCAEQLKRLQPARGEMLHALILSMGGKWGEAEPMFRRALAASPNDPDIVARYLEELGGQAARRALGEAEQKRRLAQDAKRLLPPVNTRARAIEAASNALFSAGQHEDAWQIALDGLPRADAPSIVKLQLGKVSARTGLHREQGLEFLGQAAREPLEGGTGGYAAVHWRRGQILKDLGRTDEARQAANRALGFDARHRGARELLDEIGSK